MIVNKCNGDRKILLIELEKIQILQEMEKKLLPKTLQN